MQGRESDAMLGAARDCVFVNSMSCVIGDCAFAVADFSPDCAVSVLSRNVLTRICRQGMLSRTICHVISRTHVISHS